MADLHPAVLMFVAWRHLEQRVMEAVVEAGYDDITLAQARLAARLADDGIRLTDLAEQAQLTKQSAGFLVDQLERAGYVERRPDPQDARARLICLAPRGREVQAVARKVEGRVAREWRDHLGPAAYDEMVAALSKLREVVDPWA